MKKNRILALGLSAILGVTSIPTNVKAAENLSATEKEGGSEEEISVEETTVGEIIEETTDETTVEETTEETTQETQDQVEESENVKSEEQVGIENGIATLPLLDENVEVLKTGVDLLAQGSVEDEATKIFNIDDNGVISLKDASLLKEDLVIPTHINDKAVTGIAESAFENNGTIKNVTINGNITIGNGAFKGSSVVTVNAPEVTSLGSEVFFKCTSLQSVNMESLQTITGDSTFSECYKLKDVTLPRLETIEGNETFAYSGGLERIYLPELTTIKGNKTIMGISSLNKVELPRLVLIEGDETFNQCRSLVSITEEDLPELKEIKGNQTFFRCENLADVNLPKLESIKGNETFYNYTGGKLKTVNLPKLILIDGIGTFLNTQRLSEIKLNGDIVLPNNRVFTGSTNVYIHRFEGEKESDINKGIWGAKEVKYYTVKLTIKDNKASTISETKYFDSFDLDQDGLNKLLGDAKLNNSILQVEENGTLTPIKLPYKVTGNTVLVQSPSMLPNEIQIRGRDLQSHKYRGFNVNFNTSTMKLDVNGMLGTNYQLHELRPNPVYTEIKLYNKNGKLKDKFSMQGKDLVSKALEINKMSFDFDDYIEVYHIQHTDYVTGHIENKTKTPSNRNIYRITEKGLRQINIYKNTIELRGQNIYDSKNHGFDLKFNTDEMVINVDMKEAYGNVAIHNGFGSGKYIGIKLYDKDGVEETKEFTLNAPDSALKAKEFDRTKFKFGDYIEIYHAEGKDWRYNVTGDVIEKSDEKMFTYLYEITENGLKQIVKKSEVPTPEVDNNNGGNGGITPEIDNNGGNGETTPEVDNNGGNGEATPEVKPEVDNNGGNGETTPETQQPGNNNTDTKNPNNGSVVNPVVPNDNINSVAPENNAGDVQSENIQNGVLDNEQPNQLENNIEQPSDNVRVINPSSENINLVTDNLRNTIARDGIASGVQQVLSTVGVTEENIENIGVNELEEAIGTVQEAINEVNNANQNTNENVEVEKPAFGFSENSNMGISLLLVLLLALIILLSVYVIKKQQRSHEELDYNEE